VPLELGWLARPSLLLTAQLKAQRSLAWARIVARRRPQSDLPKSNSSKRSQPGHLLFERVKK